MVNVKRIEAAATHDLRRSVLRDGTISDEVEFDGDGGADTFHLGAFAGSADGTDGPLVAIASFMHVRYPDRPASDAYQLRGMATDPDHRGSGVSGELLAVGLERCRSVGAELVWARARTTALGFYDRNGFVPVGVDYTDLATGLQHRDIIRFLH